MDSNTRPFNTLHVEWNNHTLNGIQIHIPHTTGQLKGQTETYWGFTSDQSLSARGLRQLPHHRWAIENNQFRELNEFVGSKSGYIQSSAKKHVIIFWQMIGGGAVSGLPGSLPGSS